VRPLRREPAIMVARSPVTARRGREVIGCYNMTSE
jgi:hypothetical protein